MIEALRLAFTDGHWYITDQSHTPIPISTLLSPTYLAQRAALFSPTTTAHTITPGTAPFTSCDTVYLSTTDRHGNACSFINSTFSGFGSGLIPADCGFVLQNRGAGFSLRSAHPNVLAPRKRPYHTIIPGLVTDGSGLRAVFGVMGGFMQPQGHVQVLLNSMRECMDPQRALDAPRICVGANYDPRERVVHVEEGVAQDVVEGLKEKGHRVVVVKGWGRAMFGRGQIVVRSPEGVWSAGSDLRGDGHAVGY